MRKLIKWRLFKDFRSGISISLLAVICVLIIAELCLRYYLPDRHRRQTRLIFFSEGAVFENKDWGGFVYQPNATIRSTVFYIFDGDMSTLRKEYENDFTTNSLGLVQLNQVDKFKPAILFLGDSFTEGHGAAPWFYILERHWPSTFSQIINGGILGTGVEAWGRLYDDLSRHIKIDRIVTIFTSQDWVWPVWQFSKSVLDCLRAHLHCSGREDFYSLPASPPSTNLYIRKIARSRMEHDRRTTRDASILKRTLIYRKILRPAYTTLQNYLWSADHVAREEKQFKVSGNTILRMVSAVGPKNALFIHLPMKDEIRYGPNPLGKKARNFLSQHQLRLVDGFISCKLTLDDFHVTDGHPNQTGYRKIADCVERNVKATFYGRPAT